MHTEHPIAVLLPDIRSAHNVGSIFRTADAAGVTKIFLAGFTAMPLDPAGRPQKDIAKTALGAERVVPWEYADDELALITRLKGEGWRIVGVERDGRAVDHRSWQATGPSVLVFGNEVGGISQPVLELCDEIIEIPMRGMKESLNVSVAAGIILYGILQ